MSDPPEIRRRQQQPQTARRVESHRSSPHSHRKIQPVATKALARVVKEKNGPDFKCQVHSILKVEGEKVESEISKDSIIEARRAQALQQKKKKDKMKLKTMQQKQQQQEQQQQNGTNKLPAEDYVRASAATQKHDNLTTRNNKQLTKQRTSSSKKINNDKISRASSSSSSSQKKTNSSSSRGSNHNAGPETEIWEFDQPYEKSTCCTIS